MAPKKSREEVLQEKRLREHKRLEKIKNDPILHAQLKEKERKKYLKKKRLGKIKPIGEMSPRQQKLIRQKNRINSSRYYYRKKLNRIEPSVNPVDIHDDNNEDHPQHCSPNLPDPLAIQSPPPANSVSNCLPSYSRITRSVRRNILNQCPTTQLSQPPSSPVDDNLDSSSSIARSLGCDILDQIPAYQISKPASSPVCGVLPSSSPIARSLECDILDQTPQISQSAPRTDCGDLPSSSRNTQSLRLNTLDQTPAHQLYLPPSSPVSDKSSSSSRVARRNILEQTPVQELGSYQDVTSSRDTDTPSPQSTFSETTSNPPSPQSQPLRVMKKQTNRTSIKKKSPWKYILRKMKYRTSKELQIKDKRIEELKRMNDNYRKQIQRLRNNTTESKNGEQGMRQNTKTKTNDSYKELCKTAKAQMKAAIEYFFEEDENSRLCPGKKEFITRYKVRKQKRYLNFSLQQLHQKFVKEHPEYKVSYSFFCTFRPFWVVTPNVDARDTCLCTIHENMDLAVQALKRNGIITEKSTYDVLKTLCCDPRDVKCLKRNCNTCKTRLVTYLEFDNSKESHYWIWAKSKKEYVKDGQSKVTIQCLKHKVSTYPKNIIEHFENLLNPYMSHCANIVAQNCYIKNLKSNLTSGEAIVHCDFSENYNTKYASEIQSFHFGSSRQQITLHTSVIYYIKNGALCTRSFCTLSECLRHDAIAIWEHLIPILNFIENEVPELNSLHFISDSPSSQYRNRKMFYVMAKLHWSCPTLRRVVWNYTEKGHGKGAPDGVGGLLKRTADQIVAQGHDIPNIETLISHLKNSCKGVTIEEVGESGILEKELLIPSSELKEFRGTMRVHQVIWRCNNNGVLAMRSLSCDLGECPQEAVECPHGQHIGFYDIDHNASCNDGSRVKARGKAAQKNRTYSSRQSSRKTRIRSTPNLDYGNIETSAQNNQQEVDLQSDDSFWAEISSINNNGISDTFTNDVLTVLHNNDNSKSDRSTNKNTKKGGVNKSPQKTNAKNSAFITCSKKSRESFTSNQRQVHIPPGDSLWTDVLSIVEHDIAIPSTSATVPLLKSSGSKNKVSSKTHQPTTKMSFSDTASNRTSKKNKTRNNALIKSSKKSPGPFVTKIDHSHAETLEENNQQELCVQSDDSLWNKIPSEILMPTSTPNIITELFSDSDSEDYNIF